VFVICPLYHGLRPHACSPLSPPPPPTSSLTPSLPPSPPKPGPIRPPPSLLLPLLPTLSPSLHSRGGEKRLRQEQLGRFLAPALLRPRGLVRLALPACPRQEGEMLPGKDVRGRR
jgi:hypothetical protein